MDPSELPRTWLLLIRRVGKEKILNAIHAKQLHVIEIADHPMMLEVLEQKS